MKYFVTLKEVEVASYLSRESAINEAKKLLIKNCGLDVGIGRIKIKSGKKVYILVPAHFYIN